MKIIQDNLKLIITALIALIAIVIGAVALSLAFGGETYRNITVSDIQGSVVMIRGTRQMYINKKTVLQSGDIINTDESSTVRICIDNDKYIAVEPDSSVYIYYTNISDKGEISVNVAAGAVTCQLNKKLKKNESFQVKTPNTAINVRGTVFRAEFGMKDKYMGYSDVMLTHIQNFDGSVMLQLYGTDSEKVGEPMLLTERTSAELISCDGIAQYGYLNYDIDMYSLNEITLMELIRISAEHSIAYTLDELNTALKAVRRINSTSTQETTAVTTEETSATTTTTAPPVTETEPPQTASTTVPQEETAGTVRTTLETHIYTTYAGPKWWDMPNDNPDVNDDNYDDGGVFETETVTIAP